MKLYKPLTFPPIYCTVTFPGMTLQSFHFKINVCFEFDYTRWIHACVSLNYSYIIAHTLNALTLITLTIIALILITLPLATLTLITQINE